MIGGIDAGREASLRYTAICRSLSLAVNENLMQLKTAYFCQFSVRPLSQSVVVIYPLD